MYHQNLKNEVVFIILCIIIAIIFTFCLSVPYKFIASAFALLYLASFKKYFLFLVTLIYVLIAVAFPITLNFGLPNKAHYFNMLNTNSNEAIEFLELIINIKTISLVSISIMLTLIYCYFGHRIRNKEKINNIQTAITTDDNLSKAKCLLPKFKSIYFEVLLFIALCFIGTRCYPTKLIKDTIHYTYQSLIEIEDYNKLIQTPSTFKLTKNTKKAKTIVIILGESVVTDYLSVFGYPYSTTPYLNTVPGHFYKNNISTYPYTFHSIARSFSISNKSTNTYELNNNLIALANKAGYATYFFATGKDDDKQFMNDFFGSIAKYNFLRLPKVNSNNKTSPSIINRDLDDSVLLKFFDLSLRDTEKYRVIVLHMFGHHPKVCKRLKGYPNVFKNQKHVKNNNSPQELNCYLSVTHKLDSFLAHINKALVTKGEPYYLFFLSDHGLVFELDSKVNPSIHHGERNKSNFRAPLIILSSEIKDHKVIEDYISGFDFLSLFEHYVEMDTENVPAKSVSQIKYNDPNLVPIFYKETKMSYGELDKQTLYY